jgi:prevent-host-death family protein
MSASSWSLQDAKNRFSAVVEAAKREPQTVTKHGKPAVVVVDAAEFARLRRLEVLNAPSFIEHLLAMPKDDGEFERVDSELRDVEF